MKRRLQAWIEARPLAAKVLGNSAWLGLEKVLRLVVGLAVGVWVARHLGAGGYGLLSYALAFAGLFGPLASLGLDQVAVKHLVERPQDAGRILGSTAVLRFSGALAALGLAGTGSLVMGVGGREAALVSLAAAAMVFQALEVSGLSFQARMLAKRVLVARGAAFLAGTLARVACILADGGVEHFLAIQLGEAALSCALMGLSYRVSVDTAAPWRWHGPTAAALMNAAWPFLLSGIAVAFYMRLDQVMLHAMVSSEAVGIYAVAVKLSEVWYFLPLALVHSGFPAILGRQSEDPRGAERRILELFRVLAGLGVAVTVAGSLLAPWLVQILFGAEYEGAVDVLRIHIWASVPVALGLGKEYWLVVKGMGRFSLVSTCAGAASNAALNFWLIPRWGAAGAAVATVISQVLANQVAPWFYRPAREVFWLQWRGLCFWRRS